ncbi:phosphotransferase [Bacillus sp. 31A1R]|uniref:Phosphotransferase n=1 Tax=Robertmurraya mangrovi TaxID=3098077 RepID=A0ABU5IY39_9BACI|nr:phosphotransferase [Bacillus sp. 31A1R]MDZ5472015.1 phosphotransferase [Bacillus sp. 31A1R]
MDLLKDIVLPSGYLDYSKIEKSEIVYKGTNGRNVERFYVSNSQSFIFKPLTNNSQLGKEIWIYDEVLPSLPPIYPRVFEKSISNVLNSNWIIFEDLGHLQHQFNGEIATKMSKFIADWHSNSNISIKEKDSKGPKPFIEDIVADLKVKRTEVLKSLPEHALFLDFVYSFLEHFEFSKKMVFSHGDLHLGNYCIVQDRLVVLDWEHAHYNIPFWDLYHLLDMSHPLFPKEVSQKLREHVLDEYLNKVNIIEFTQDKDAFKKEYYVFAAVFSIWMISLIQGDLNRNDEKWPKDQLKNQLAETTSSFEQCVEQLKKYC